MQALLPALAAGGIVGVADQYLCLLVLGVASRMGWVELNSEMMFLESWWFLGLVGVLWILTVAPAYLSTVAPGVVNAIHTAINFVSGFMVPVSSALIALASAGIISQIHPEAHNALLAIGLFNPEAGPGMAEAALVGGTAVTASSLTVMKGLSKPAISTSTGTVGTVSAPIYATLENVASVVLMGLVIFLANLDPRLLVVLLAVVVTVVVVTFIYALYLLWKLKKGIGRVIDLIRTEPRKGWAVVAEFFVWGSGWLLNGHSKRGGIMLTLWLVSVVLFVALLPLATVTLVLLVPFIAGSLMLFGLVAGRTSKSLLQTVAPAPSSTAGEASGWASDPALNELL